jgi:N-acetylgalactosamine kinase
MTIFAPVSAWLDRLDDPGEAFTTQIARLRNESAEDAEEAIVWYADLTRLAIETFEHDSDTQMGIIRAPGRVNLLGTHVDHRGGRVNPIAVREVAVICFPRADGQIRIANANLEFPPHEFAIADLLPDAAIPDWTDWTFSTPKLLEDAALLGHWSSYVRAPVAYFTNLWNRPAGLQGFDLFIDSELPKAAGLSSSSALVVATAYALHLVNDRPFEPIELAEACGQAEWYVGTRGGAGDQAAIALGKSGQVSHLDFFPMDGDWSPWPDGYSVVVCHSRVHAQKTANARSIFNERVATYVIALTWVKRLYPQWEAKLEHLRDILRLGVSTQDIYEMLLRLPPRASREQIVEALPDDIDELTKLFGTHDDPEEGYRVRDICLYGLAECQRSERLADCLRAGDIIGAGRLIDLSHEGDRVTRIDQSGARVPCDTGVSDEGLSGLIADISSSDESTRDAASLAMQPGGYACSAPDVDELVDLARGVDGVVGAGLIGAGLGGCVEVVVRDDSVDRLRDELLRCYYEKYAREPFIEVMRPVEGCCALLTK